MIQQNNTQQQQFLQALTNEFSAQHIKELNDHIISENAAAQQRMENFADKLINLLRESNINKNNLNLPLKYNITNISTNNELYNNLTVNYILIQSILEQQSLNNKLSSTILYTSTNNTTCIQYINNIN